MIGGMKFLRWLILVVLGILLLIFGIQKGFLNTSILHNQNVIRMKVLKNQWKFQPDTVVVRAGRKITLRIYNEDSYPHGFSIKELGINEPLVPMRETTIVFTPENKGTFGFYCSVLCGDGHYRMSGKLIVR